MLLGWLFSALVECCLARLPAGSHLLPADLPAPCPAPAPPLPPPLPLPLQTPHGIKRKESEALQVQHETQGANKKPRVVWSVEMHQQVGAAAGASAGAGLW